MKITKSEPLVRLLLARDVAFVFEGPNVVIKDEDYKVLIDTLKSKDIELTVTNEDLVIKPLPEAKSIPKQKPIPSKRIPHEMFKKLPEDEPKRIQRPPAVYSNRNWAKEYGDETD